MSRVSVNFQSCPWTPGGKRDVHFTRCDLRHAALAVGRDWRFRGITTAERAAIQARIHEIISVVDLQGRDVACVSSHYRGVGSTMRGAMSFILGNTFCALIAEKELNIPWLVDVEALSHHYHVQFRGTRRAEFIGRTSSRRWFAFEAKGRSYCPPDSALDYWKDQADSVRRINGQRPEAKIVSATYASNDNQIHSIWRDPPADEGEDAEFSDETFFQSYDTPIMNLMDNNDYTEMVGREKLLHFPNLECRLASIQRFETA